MKKRCLYINDANTKTNGDEAAEKWLTPVNWEKDRTNKKLSNPTIAK